MRPAGRGQQIVTDALPVTGYGAIGVTWEHGTELSEDAVGMRARTYSDGRWSGWTELEYHDDHGPDPTTAEGRRSRPGSEPLLVGEVDKVQVRIDTDRAAPADLSLAVVDPGAATATARQAPAIDTAALDTGTEAGTETGTGNLPVEVEVEGEGQVEGEGGDIALAAAETTPKPTIFSRAQWGANERLRDTSSLHYYEVHAGFVHHTVNANDYTRAQVPAIIRGIYAYHTRSRGWSDLGYNFLVDKFGRIWEGRYGGVDRAVVGAHTLGYNEYSFAASAIGNYDVARPSAKVVSAIGRLMAWKLSLYGVSAASTRQQVGSRAFRAINGHRDAGSTACPGRYLYAQLGKIRQIAAASQASWSGRERESQMVAGIMPDIVVRRASDGRGMVAPLRRNKAGRMWIGRPRDTGLNLRDASQLMTAGDWDRDGKVDLIVRRKSDTAVLVLHRGLGRGRFAAGTTLTTRMGGVRLLAAVGDVTGDGWPDLMGQPRNGAMMIYPGRGVAGVTAAYRAHSAVRGRGHIGVGRWDGDGSPDSIVRQRRALVVWRGNGPGGWVSSRSYAMNARQYDWMIGISSLNAGTHSDLVTRSRGSGDVWLLPGTAGAPGTPIRLGKLSGYDLAG